MRFLKRASHRKPNLGTLNAPCWDRICARAKHALESKDKVEVGEGKRSGEEEFVRTEKAEMDGGTGWTWRGMSTRRFMLGSVGKTDGGLHAVVECLNRESGVPPSTDL